MKSVVVYLVLLFILQLLLIQPFFHSGFFPTHDDIQTIRIFEYFQSLNFGGIPPRWSSGLLFGYGYPLFVFYSPLAYFLGTLFAFLGLNFLLATKMVFILSFLIGVSGIFFLVRFFTGNIPAFFASIIYSLVPYRAVEVYVRGDLAEFFALSLFPWILWINMKLLKDPRENILVPIFALFLGFLILSHNISVFIYGIFLIIFNFFYIIEITKNKRLVIDKISCSAIFALLLSSFYWLPLIYEIQFVSLNKITEDHYDNYFLTLSQIWNSPWGYGGFLQNNPMSLQLGQILIVVSGLAFILNISIKTVFRKIIYFFFTLFIILILMETKITQPVWDVIKPLQFMQFPWRLHILVTLCGTILAAFFFYLFKSSKIYKKKRGKIIFFIFGIILIILSFRESYSFFRAKSFIEAKPAAATTTGEEYLPVWVKKLPSKYPADKIEFLGSQGKIDNVEWGYYKKKFDVTADQKSRIRIAHIYYPGWEVFVNNAQTGISFNNEYGTMEIEVPKGKNTVTFLFTRTWWRLLSEMLSFLTFLIFIFWIIKYFTGKKLN